MYEQTSNTLGRKFFGLFFFSITILSKEKEKRKK